MPEAPSPGSRRTAGGSIPLDRRYLGQRASSWDLMMLCFFPSANRQSERLPTEDKWSSKPADPWTQPSIDVDMFYGLDTPGQPPHIYSGIHLDHLTCTIIGQTSSRRRRRTRLHAKCNLSRSQASSLISANSATVQHYHKPSIQRLMSQGHNNPVLQGEKY